MPIIKYKNKTYGGSSGTNIVLDTELNINSENGVQNKVITEALNGKIDKMDVSAIADALGYTPASDELLEAHLENTGNPHNVTAEQVGADPAGSASTALTEAKNYTNTKIADLVNSAPETLDTLGEIANAIEENETIVEALNAAIGNKVNKTDIDTILSDTSTNPVQNKIITAALANKQDWLIKPTIIDNSIDWNTLTTTSIYPIGIESGLADNNTHGLNGVYGYGMLIILASKGGYEVYQVYINDAKQIYLRSKYNTWRQWIRMDINRVATDSQLGSIKSGGDITVASDGTVSVNGLNDKADKSIVEALQVKVDSLEIEHYAFTIDQNEENPASMITYPAGCDNTNFASAKMNYTTGVFDYGSWGNAFFIKNLKVVMLNYDGTEAYEINPNNYTQKKAGGAVGTEGNVMIAFPKTYYKIIDNGDNTATVHISNHKLDDDYKCWSHIGLDGKEKDWCYMAAYDGSYVGGKLRSLTGQSPMVSQTAQEEVNRALANNPNSSNKNWYTGVAADRILVQILLMLISKNTNSQDVFGYGFANENSAAINSGTMDTKGLFWGESGGKQGVKVFGIENFWGSAWKRTAGWINANGAQKVKMTYGTQDGSTVTGYNFDGTGYTQINTCPNSVWLKGMTFHQFGFFPKTKGGSSSTYYSDHFFANNSQVNYATVGGGWLYGTYAGAFTLSLTTTASYAFESIGASLSYKKGG